MVPDLCFVIVLLCWLSFGVFFVWRRIRLPSRASRRAPGAWIGLGLQGLGFAVAFVQTSSGPFAWPAGLGVALEGGVAIVAAVLVIASTWFSLTAAARLGRQWTFSAQIQRGHRLIVDGPYGVVRHPIYLGMLGMLWATGLALGGPLLIGAGTILYLVGSAMRTRVEDRLLAETFGPEFDAYRRAVPALIPWFRKR